MKFFKKFVVFFIVSTIVFTSCKDEYTICNEEKTVKLNANFYKIIGGVETTTTASNLKVTTFYNGTTIVSNQPNLSTFSLPLDFATDTLKFAITLADNLPKDTVTFIYTSQIKVLGSACGQVYFHKLTNALTTTNSLDSIKIINPDVQNTFAPNAKFYF
jgi:hypothetical protein